MSLINSLYSYIKYGGSGSNQELADRFGTSKASIRATIHRLRMIGIPIERPLVGVRKPRAVYRLSDYRFYKTSPTRYQKAPKGRPRFSEYLY
jgi:predicted DNA-binding transcriptional regulator YafY